MTEQPPVLAQQEIGAMLDLSKRRVTQLIARDDFPARLSVSRVWSYNQVKTWAESNGRVVHPIPDR